MIVLNNREMLIPKLERYIGTTYDDNAEIRVFKIDRADINGVDLSDLSFRLDLQYENSKPDTALLDKEITEESILLTWVINKGVLQVPGAIFANIRATDMVGTVKWASFKAAFYVEPVINTPGEYTGSLTEMEQLETRIDAKIDALDVNEELRQVQENTRQENESVRIDQELAREEKTDAVINTFETAIADAEKYAKRSESAAIGGVLPGDLENNALYYCIKAENYALLAQQVSKINYPNFHIDSNTGILIAENGKGITAFIESNGHLNISDIPELQIEDRLLPEGGAVGEVPVKDTYGYSWKNLDDGFATDQELQNVAKKVPDEATEEQVIQLLDDILGGV